MNRVGFVETPQEIADLMVSLSNTDKNALILDTGCGRGVFLQSLRKQGFTNVWGIEVDRELYEYCSEEFKDYNIILGDFLTHAFNQKFDLIIGNPPYVHFSSLPSEIARNVRELIGTSEGDIYYAFILKSISLLKEGGELIYIVPYHFLYNTYAKRVREMLLKSGKIEVIIDLNETRLFRNENPETIVFKFKKGNYDLKKERITLLNIKTRKTNSLEIYNEAIEALDKETSNELFDYAVIPHYLTSEPWSTYIFNIPEFPSVRLKDIAKVGVGLVSGFDEAFVISKDATPKFNNEEINFVKRFVKGRNCKRFIVDDHELYIVIDDTIRSENELKSTYPNIYQKVLPFKDKMTKRYLPRNKEWFHWQALRNYDFLLSNMDKKRIYVPTLDRRPYNRFSLGDTRLLPSGDVLFIQPNRESDVYFLLGYLNSTFFRNYYLTKGGRRGGRVSFTQRLLENVEIPLFPDETREKIISITKEILSKLQKGENTAYLEQELDDVIFLSVGVKSKR